MAFAAHPPRQYSAKSIGDPPFVDELLRAQIRPRTVPHRSPKTKMMKRGVTTEAHNDLLEDNSGALDNLKESVEKLIDRTQSTVRERT